MYIYIYVSPFADEIPRNPHLTTLAEGNTVLFDVRKVGRWLEVCYFLYLCFIGSPVLYWLLHDQRCLGWHLHMHRYYIMIYYIIIYGDICLFISICVCVWRFPIPGATPKFSKARWPIETYDDDWGSPNQKALHGLSGRPWQKRGRQCDAWKIERDLYWI